MGGLIAQILLSEGLASAAVAIDSAPPKGVFVLSYSFLKANWPSLNPFADINEPIHLTLEEFSYAFTNQQTSLGQIQAYENFYVPESRRVGRAPLTDEARINRFQARGPLLLVAGGEDHIIPARLNYANFEFYKEARTENYTEFIMLEGKDHWGIAGRRWEEVARSIKVWLADIEYKEWLTNLK